MELEYDVGSAFRDNLVPHAWIHYKQSADGEVGLLIARARADAENALESAHASVDTEASDMTDDVDMVDAS